MRKLQVILLVFLMNNLDTFQGQETDGRNKREVRVVRKKIRVDTKEETDEESDSSDVPREGRHLGLLADLYLSLQCTNNHCQASLSTAQMCCVRNFNLNCCRYRQHHQHQHLVLAPAQHHLFSPSPSLPTISQTIFGLKPAVLPFSVGVSLGLQPSQAFPPVYPFQQDHHLPSDQYPPQRHPDDQYPQHHHPDDQYPPYHHQDDHHHQPHDQVHHGSIRPLHNYKPGVCPHQDGDFYKGPIFHGVYNDVPIVPGTSSSSYSSSYSSTCTYDTDCRGTRKCCHVRVAQHRLVMECRHPLTQHGYSDNNWKWRSNEENIIENDLSDNSKQRR